MTSVQDCNSSAGKAPRKVLYLLSIWPEAEASAASQRSLLLAASLRSFGYTLVLGADEREKESCLALRREGYRCERLLANDEGIEGFLREYEPDIVIFDRFATEEKYSWRIRSLCPRAVRILDTIDLHFLRTARERLIQGEWLVVPSDQELHEIAEDVATREVAAIYRSDLSLVVSDFERDYLKQKCGVPRELICLHRLPYPKAKAKGSFETRRDFGMIGNLRHAPNQDALSYLAHILWPKIRTRIPDAVMHVWGAHAKPEHLAMQNPLLGFYVHGRAAHVHEVLAKVRVNLAPLRSGAGIKGKIADGWWVGTPVVTTPIGAEGMHEGMSFGGTIAESAESFVEAAVALYENEELWTRASQAGVALMDCLFSESACQEPLRKKLDEILLDIDQLRRQNFTGTMVWQQGLRSAEYFSRWVEAKQQQKKSTSLEKG